MKFRNKAIRLVAIVAVALTACGGDDSKSSSTAKATNLPAVTTIAPETTPAPPTTVEATTTTEAAPEFQYEIVFLGDVVLDDKGHYDEDIPIDGSIPLNAVSPVKPSMTLSEVMALLPPENQICLRGGLRNQDGTFADLTADVLGTGLTSEFHSQTGETVTFVGIQVSVFGGFVQWVDAVIFGALPSPDGITWATEKFLTPGACN